MIDFIDISYLSEGNPLQKKLYHILVSNQIIENLHQYNPIVVGTIPIEINIEESDADIILYSTNLLSLQQQLRNLFSEFKDFSSALVNMNSIESLVVRFKIDDLDFEIFAQPIPTHRQNAYLHMLKEYEILQNKPKGFKEAIIKLKESGVKTEPAFAQLLGLEGNPYESLLKYRIR